MRPTSPPLQAAPDQRSGTDLPGPALGWIGTEWANLQAAARQAMASGRADDAVRLAGAMGEYVRPCGGSVHEAEAPLTAALALDGLAPDVHCEALCTLAWLEAQLGDDDALRAATTDAMATADRIGDARLQTLTLVTRAALAGGPQAGAQLGRAIELASASGATGLRIRALANLATFEGNRGHYAAALDHFTQARRAAEAEGSTLIATHTLANMSQCLLQLGRPDAAIELLEEAIPRLRRVAGGPSMLAWCLGMLAVAESLSGRPRGAHGHLIESARLTIEADTAETMAEYLQAAAISLAEDHPREAAAALGAFTSIRPGSERSGSLEVRPLIGSTEQRLIRTLGAAASAVIRRRGEATPPRDVVHGLLQLLESHDPATHVRLRGRFGTFTARERDVITRLAQGMSDSEISRELFISPKTVSVHVANIKAKFGVSTRVEAALQAQAAVGTADTPPV